MLRLLSLSYLIITFSYAQIAPSYQPYSLIYSEIKLPSTLLVIESDDIYIDFIENSSIIEGFDIEP